MCSRDEKSSAPVRVVPLLLSFARQRLAADPTPDAYTVLSKLAKHYRPALHAHWLWNPGFERYEL
jgi:hypothetical protein